MRQRMFVLVVLVCLVALIPPGVVAKPLEARVSPTAQPGFPLLLDSSFAFLSGINAADLNGDGKKELIFGVRELDAGNTTLGGFGCRGVVYAVKSDGTLLWRAFVRADVDSTPAVIDDLNGDGRPDVVVGMGAFEIPAWGESAATECGKGNPSLAGNGGVVALNGLTGAVLWVFDTADKGEWAVPNNGVLDGVWGAPATGDIRPDISGPETVVGAWDNCVYLIDKNGNAVWGIVPFSYNTFPTLQGQCNNHGFLSHDTVWSSPALADIDKDGLLDIIIGGDSTAPNWYGMPSGGVLWVISGSGQIIARKWFDQAIFSSPAVADLDGDGKLEILIGSGDASKNPAGNQYLGHYVTALNFDGTQVDPAQRLVTKWQVSTNGPVRSSPAIGDLNLDGILDVVAISKYDNNGSFTVGSPGKSVDGSYIYAWNGATGAVLAGFPAHACNSLGQAFPINGSPILADIAGGNQPEILFPNAREVGIVNWDGSFYTRINDVLKCAPAPASQTTLVYGRLDAQSGAITATPLVADLDEDGDLEVAVVARYNEDNPPNNRRGEVLVWTSHKEGDLPWSMFHSDAQHTGRFGSQLPVLKVPISSIYLMHQLNNLNPEKVFISIRNTGGGSIDWNATPPTGVTTTPSSGTVTGISPAQPQVTISTAGYPLGVHALGNIVVSGTSGGSAVTGSPASISVTLRIVQQLFKINLPLLAR